MTAAGKDPRTGPPTSAEAAATARFSPLETAIASTVMGASASTGTPAESGEQPDLWAQAVRVLTDAARPVGPDGPRQEDFAGFLASVLAAVTANVGGIETVLAGRPGSWEADLVRQLVNGTVGHDGEFLLQHRTEPVVIPLHVHRLIWDQSPDYTTPFDQEIDEVTRRYADLSADEYDSDAEDAEIDKVTAFWAARYAAYAEAFTAAVQAEAALIEGLTVPVTVTAITDPDAGFEDCPEHPDEFTDRLAWRLWDAAERALPLPARGPEQNS